MSLIDKIKDALGFQPSQKFHIGQSITTTDKPNWRSNDKMLQPRNNVSPKFGEIVKVIKYCKCIRNVYTKKLTWSIVVSGYPGEFDQDSFTPVIETHELNELLKDIEITV